MCKRKLYKFIDCGHDALKPEVKPCASRLELCYINQISAEVPNGFFAEEISKLEAECRKNTNSSRGWAWKTERVAGLCSGCVKRQEAEAARQARELEKKRAIEIEKRRAEFLKLTGHWESGKDSQEVADL